MENTMCGFNFALFGLGVTFGWTVLLYKLSLIFKKKIYIYHINVFLLCTTMLDTTL